jgi:hypothetical protein
MSAKPKKQPSERRFQIFLVLLSAFVGFAAGILTMWLQQQSENSNHKAALIRIIRSAIVNDLQYSIRVIGGLKENVNKGYLDRDVTIFRIIYHPTVELPAADEMGILEPRIVASIDEYKRRLKICEENRSEHLKVLEGTNQDNINSEMTLEIYVVSLDSVILTGLNVIHQIDLNYPSAKDGSIELPEYSPLAASMDQFSKSINSISAERLGQQQSKKMPANK